MHPGEGAAIGRRSRNENIRMTSQVGDPLALGLCIQLWNASLMFPHDGLVRRALLMG